MSEANLVTLLCDLCKTLIETSGAEISENESKGLCKKALSNLFLYRGETEDTELSNAYQSLRLEIISNVFMRTRSREDVNQKLDQYLACLETLYSSSDADEKEVLNGVFTLLCKLTDRSANRSNDSTLKQESSSIMRFNGSNWDIFHEDPFPQPLSFEYPFHEPCEIRFPLNDTLSSCTLISNVDQIFDHEYKIWNFDENKLVEPVVLDEGFVTPGSKFSEEDRDSLYSSSCSSSSSSNNLVAEVANLKFGKQTWEQLGCNVYDVEPPFACERVENVIHFWKIWNAWRNLREETYALDSTRCISFNALKEDIRDLLFGLESPTFVFNNATKMFHIGKKIHMKTLTPETLSQLCVPFMLCASHFKCLTTFVKNRLSLQFGPVHYFFCLSLRDVLEIYRYSLLRIPWHNLHFLSEFEPLIETHTRKMTFLTKFCLISMGHEADGSNFPSGVQLLDYLYDNMLKISRTDIEFILFHLFEKSCNSYFKIVAEWMFDGCFSNPGNYEEFFIDIQREDEICRDWRRVSCIKVKERRVPKFLQASYKEIFVCGKSVNLLKIFTSKEVVETLLSINHPEVKCCFNKDQLDKYIAEWKDFRITNTSDYNPIDRIKNKLLRKYGPEFYAKIKRIREDWLNRYQESTNGVSGSNGTNIVEKNETTLDKTCVIDAQSSNETILKSSTEEAEEGTNCGDVTESPMKTKQLVEFYENLNKDATNTSPSAKSSESILSDKSSILESPAEKSPLENTRQNFTIHAMNTAAEKTNENVDASFAETVHSFGDHRNQRENSSAFIHTGGGDAMNSASSPSFSIGPGGDSRPDLSEYEKNRRHSKVGDYQMLATTNEFKTPTNRTMTELERNRLRIMSSFYQQSVNDENSLKPVSSSTPMNELSKNKLKVLSSEYHQRLCDTSESQPTVRAKSSEELSECEKNKLKVMSSEYYSRLTNSVEEKPRAIPMKLNQRDLNRLKAMSSEYHIRLNESATTKIIADESIVDESVKTPTTQNDESLVEDNEDSEMTNEDIVSEDVTVVEAKEVEKSVREEESDRVLDTKSPERENVFILEDYMSKENVFPHPDSLTANDLKSIADSVNDVSRTSVLYYLSQSVIIPLKIQSKLVNDAILHVFIEEERYLDHLLTLRNYLFLRKPQFSQMLTNTIFKMAEKAKRPYSLMNNTTLNGILQQSLLAASNKQITSFEKKLSFVVDGAIPEAFDLTDIKMLNGVSFNYSVKWPINVLITEPISRKYTRLFRFLFQIQRASWSLKNDFIKLKNLKQGKSIQYSQIQLYRYNMTHVVRILQDFIMREALETCWNELVECMTRENISLDDLYLAHLKYVNKIMQRCFLCDLSISCHESWLKVLSSVLKYRAALRAGSWKRNTQVNFVFHTNFKEVHAVYQEFDKCLNDVRSKLKMLVYAKKRTHFEPLLLGLCRNTNEEECT